MEVSKRYTFEASHQVANDPGRCSRLHGHSWVLTVTCEGLVNPETGMVINYHDIDKFVKPLIERLDHQHLGSGFVNYFESPNETDLAGKMTRVWLPSTVVGLNIKIPTCENLLYWIAEQLFKELPWSKLKINETCTTEAILTRDEYLEFVL